MKILLDENLHEGLAAEFAAHEAVHVNAIGWQGLKNGALFARTEAEGFEAFVTADKNMPYQQNMKARPFVLIVRYIHPNILASQSACVPLINAALADAEPGSVIVIPGPHPKRLAAEQG